MLLGRGENTGMQTFKYSITYLMALFVVMLADHYLIEKPTVIIVGG